MKRLVLLITALMLAAICAAQEPGLSLPDGPGRHAGTLNDSTRTFLPPMFPPPLMMRPPKILYDPLDFETKEQRAARSDAMTTTAVMKSMQQSLYPYRPPHLTREWRLALRFGGMFLSNPFGFPEGCIPLVNASFPFIYVKVPGKAPYEHPYSPDKIPQCIKAEYDMATGTYKQVAVDLKKDEESPGKESHSGGN